MIYRKGGRWALCPYVITYKEHGKEKEKHVADKSWWERTVDKHDHLEIIKIEDAEYSDEEKQRIKEAERVPSNFQSVAENYVKYGKFPDELEGEERREDHPLKVLQLEKEDLSQWKNITELEIESIMKEQELTDIEIMLLEAMSNE